MKKLLCSAAICGVALAATPAHAQVKLDLGGWFKGYGAYVDQDEAPGVAGENRDFDILRHTEVHFGGETTLDNGLTVGAHIETEADGEDGFEVEESYVYMSGGWGRVNFGAEDGAAYLLQVAAPSADDNYDGLRQYIQPVNYTQGGSAALNTFISANGLDYDQNTSGYADKLTYLSPILNGFQAGVSYTPDVADTAADLNGVGVDEVGGALGSVYEAAVRYEGQFNNVGIVAGAGYALTDLEDDAAVLAAGTATDDREAWNAGIDLTFGPFGLGAVYKNDNFGDTSNTGTAATRDDEETWVFGADYTTGPFKFGASYLTQDGTGNVAGATGTDGVDTDRYTGGVVYTYGPGMTFRGSVSRIEHDNVAGITGSDSIDATSVLVGTQINF